MDKRVKTIISIASVTAIGTILPTLTALFASGFSTNNFVISNYTFIVGILTAAAGGLGSIFPFFIYKSKLRKARRGEEVEVEARKGLRWDYILMAAGLIIIVISYCIAVL